MSQVEGECAEWITEHQEHLEQAFRLASERTEREALRRQARNNLKATDTSLPVGARVFLRNRVKGRNKMQDMWNATPYKVTRRLDTGNTYVVTSLMVTVDEEESRKTVHRTDILHATQLVKDMGLGTSQSSDCETSGDVPCRDVPLEVESASEGEEDDLELVVSCRQTSVPGAVPEDVSCDFDQQLMLDGDNAPSQLEVPQEDVAHTGQEQQTEAELAVDGDGDAVPWGPEASQTSTTRDAGSEVRPADEVSKSNPPVRRSTRAGAGQHSNPYHLPRPVMREDMAAAVIDPQILNSIAQSNLLIVQMLAKNVHM